MSMVLYAGLSCSFSVSLSIFFPVHQKEIDLVQVTYGGFNCCLKLTLSFMFFSAYMQNVDVYFILCMVSEVFLMFRL